MNYSKPFVITGHTKIPSGVYQFGQERTGWGQRKIEALQLFHRPKVTKRVRWMRLGVMRYFRRTNILKEWKRVTKRMLDKGLK